MNTLIGFFLYEEGESGEYKAIKIFIGDKKIKHPLVLNLFRKVKGRVSLIALLTASVNLAWFPSHLLENCCDKYKHQATDSFW